LIIENFCCPQLIKGRIAMDFKYIVIGCGIMGSAGAMHLATSSKGVAIIGPSEAMAGTDSAVPKGSHHDVGRITRMLDPDPFWGSLAKRSIERYRKLEGLTGIQFFNECGFLWMDNDPVRVTEMARLAADDAPAIERLTNAGIKERFSYLSAEEISAALYQSRKSGTINPRAYVQAMAARAQDAGAQLIYDHVISLELTPQGVNLRTAANRLFSAEKILLTTGAYGAIDRLIGQNLPLRACKTGVVLIEVSRQTASSELANMPCIISRPPPSRPNTYLLPPLKYPDGKYYLKIGIAAQGPLVKSADKLNRWLRNGRDSDTTTVLLTELRRIFPQLDLSEHRYMPCVTCHTSDARPIVDLIGEGRIGLLLGGNGYAAKSGDALGELGAALLQGTSWPGPAPRRDLSLARFGAA
jgi:sarcosine oxidase